MDFVDRERCKNEAMSKDQGFVLCCIIDPLRQLVCKLREQIALRAAGNLFFLDLLLTCNEQRGTGDITCNEQNLFPLCTPFVNKFLERLKASKLLPPPSPEVFRVREQMNKISTGR